MSLKIIRDSLLAAALFLLPELCCAGQGDMGFHFGKPYYSHLFIDRIYKDSDVIIPCQSVYDVQIAARLGFRYIEANVHPTATPGKYVVMHGYKGKLGYQVTDLEGNDVPDVVIAGTSFEDLMTKYVYRSKYPKYRTHISSLEEFLYECRANGIAPMIQYVDEVQRGIVHSIMGDDVIFYNGNRDHGYKGPIMEYRTNKTKEDILARCRAVGPPYMYCMGNVGDFTDEQLSEIVREVHLAGCHIGIAGCYENPVRNVALAGLGFDFSASGWEINEIADGNLCNLSGDLDFSGFRGGRMLDGILYLADGQRLKPAVKFGREFLSGASLHIRFKGRLHIRCGEYINNDFESDGSKSVWLSTYFLDMAPDLEIRAAGSAEIHSITFKVSRM